MTYFFSNSAWTGEHERKKKTNNKSPNVTALPSGLMGTKLQSDAHCYLPEIGLTLYVARTILSSWVTFPFPSLNCSLPPSFTLTNYAQKKTHELGGSRTKFLMPICVGLHRVASCIVMLPKSHVQISSGGFKTFHVEGDPRGPSHCRLSH